MTAVNGRKLYMIVDATSGEMMGYKQWGFRYEPPGEVEPVPDAPAGQLAVYVDDATLGGLSAHEFYEQKYASVNAGEFQSWMNRSSAPNLSLVGGNPKADGSNTPTIDMEGAVISSDFRVEYSFGGVECNLANCEGVTDGAGDASWKIRCHGRPKEGSFTVQVFPKGHSNWLAAQLVVTVDMGTFA